MAKRKKPVEEERELTRKEVRIRACDRERNRRLYIGVGIAVGLALLIILVGAVLQFAVRPNQAIASVGDDQIITRDFWKRIHFEQWQMQNQLAQMQQLQSQFGQNFFASQISQLQNTLASPFALGVQVLDKMIDEKIIEQQAAARGITVSEDEIAAALREEIANGRGAVTESQATATVESETNATATAASWTPTPVPTIDVSSTVTATATALPTPEPLPTRPIISDTGYTEGLNVLTENLAAAGGLTLDEYRRVIRMRLLTEKLQEAITAETVSPTEEQVHARHILIAIREPSPTPTDTLTTTTTAVTEPLTASVPLTNLGGVAATSAITGANALTASEAARATAGLTGTEALSGTQAITAEITPPNPDPNAPRTEAEALALAQELRRRILAGEDFAKLAAEYSDDPSSANNGGDLGWFGRGRMVAPFEDAAFSLPVNEISEPVKTDFGYHLIEVLEKASDRPKDEQQLQQEQQQAFQTWLQEQKTAADIKRPDDLAALLPTDLQR